METLLFRNTCKDLFLLRYVDVTIPNRICERMLAIQYYSAKCIKYSAINMNVVTAIPFYVKYQMQTVICTIELYIHKNYVQTLKNNVILQYDTTITMKEIMTNIL